MRRLSLVVVLMLFVTAMFVARDQGFTDTDYLSEGNSIVYELNFDDTCSFRFMLEVPLTGDFDMYLFTLLGYAGWEALSYPRYASDARQLSIIYSQTDAFGVDEQFVYTCTANTEYRLLVIAWDDCGEGTYTLTVSETTFSPIEALLALLMPIIGLVAVILIIACCCYLIFRRRRRPPEIPPISMALSSTEAPPAPPPTPPRQILFCPNCGGSISPGSRFCMNCGYDLTKLRSYTT